MTVFVLIFVNRKNTVVTVFSCIADGGLTEVFADFLSIFCNFDSWRCFLGNILCQLFGKVLVCVAH